MKFNATNPAGRNRRGASRFEVFLIIVVVLAAFDLTRRFVQLSVRWSENQKRADLKAKAASQPVPEPTNAAAPNPAGNTTPVMVPAVAAATAVATQNVTMQSAQYVFVAPPPNPARPPVARAPAGGGGGGSSGRVGGDILLSPQTIQYLVPNSYITIALPIDEDDTNAPPATNALAQPLNRSSGP